MKKKKRTWLWVLLAIATVILCIVLFGGSHEPHLMLDTAVVSQGSTEQTVTATGEIQPVYKVTVGTQVSGIVKRIYVDYNSTVKKGDLLAELDKSLLQEQLNIARASLSVSTSQRNLAQKNYERAKTLFAQNAATQQEYDMAEAEYEQAQNQLVNAQANYDNALTQLRYAEIHSPIDGIVIKKQVEEGQTVQGAYSVPDLFVIAKNMTEIQVEAKIDEADIGQVRTGQPVSFKVDAFPDDLFTGTVTQIRKEPIVNNSVVTYAVIITAGNPDEKLFPGMTASVTITVQEGSGLVAPYYATEVKPDAPTLHRLRSEGYTIDTLNGQGKYLWVKEGHHLQQKEVSFGVHNKINGIVLSGLAEGDTVVTAIVNLTK